MKRSLLLPAFLASSVILHAELPSYSVVRTRNPINVDGRLDDATWEKVQPLGKFTQTADGAVAPVETEAKIVFDDHFLYFAFRCEDPNLVAVFQKRDDNLWEEEAMEVFVQPDPAQPDYIELEINPLGTLLDIYLLDIRKAIPHKSWNSAKIKWAVKVDGTVDGKPGDKGWTCEIALPLEDLVTAPHRPPHPGDSWRLNLFRIEKLPTPVFLAWSPPGGNDFHIPKKFGTITFSDQVVP